MNEYLVILIIIIIIIIIVISSSILFFSSSSFFFPLSTPPLSPLSHLSPYPLSPPPISTPLSPPLSLHPLSTTLSLLSPYPLSPFSSSSSGATVHCGLGFPVQPSFIPDCCQPLCANFSFPLSAQTSPIHRFQGFFSL